MDEAKDNILDKVAAKGLILPKGPTNGFTRSYLEKNTNSSLFAKYLVKLDNKWDQKCAQENRAYAYIDQKSTNRNISEWRKQGKISLACITSVVAKMLSNSAMAPCAVTPWKSTTCAHPNMFRRTPTTVPCQAATAPLRMLARQPTTRVRPPTPPWPTPLAYST